METIEIISNIQSNAIKQINKARLDNRNNWYQIKLIYGSHIFKLKIYNTWIQLGYKYDMDNNLVNTFDNCMDRTPIQFKNDLALFINN